MHIVGNGLLASNHVWIESVRNKFRITVLKVSGTEQQAFIKNGKKNQTSKKKKKQAMHSGKIRADEFQ